MNTTQECPPHISRARFLLENNHITLSPFAIWGKKKVYSNCWGTMIHVLGLEHLFLEHFPHTHTDTYIDMVVGNMDGRCIFPVEKNRPGYIDRDYMNWFLRGHCQQEEELQRDFIVCTYSGAPSSRRLLHTGLCVGEDKGTVLIFEQLGYGERVQVQTYEDVTGRLEVKETRSYRSPTAFL